MSTSEHPCKKCGAENYKTCYGGDIGKMMKKMGFCFNCAFWQEKVDNKRRFTIIDGSSYVLGNSSSDAKYRGMAGRTFTVRHFRSGTVKSYNDVWHQGTVPDHFRDELPDNAEFANGAKKVDMGDGHYAFNDSI